MNTQDDTWLMLLHVNDNLHGKYLHFTHKNTCGYMREMSRECEVIVELYCTYMLQYKYRLQYLYVVL